MAQSQSFNTNNSITAFPPDVRQQDIYPKVSEMMDFIISNFESEITDTKFKWTGPNQLSEDTIKEIITELGFGYIRGVMDTITNFEFNTLVSFVSLLNLLKGQREGFELVLRLLGFDSIIIEWWEASPEQAPWTFELVVIMDTTLVPNVFETLQRIQTFARHYVFPKISNVDFRFSLDSFAERAVIMSGFVKQTRSTSFPIFRRANI